VDCRGWTHNGQVGSIAATRSHATILQMRTCPDGRTAEHGAARLSWLVALAGILFVAAIAVLAVWATPPGWLLPIRQHTVSVLGWIKKNWLSTAAVGTMAAVAGVLAPFLMRWLDRRHPIQPAGQGQDTLQRAVMLRRVRYKWITGVLEPSLARAALLVLGLERRPDLLDLGTRTAHRPGHPPEPLPPGTPIGEAFERVGGGLLILGPPGAGKTTTLLQLCDQLLDRAKHDASQPIPVVVNLASWAQQRPPLGDWLVEELASSYQIPRQIAMQWIEQDALALLLDGLDEVTEGHRAACAEAVNAWRLDHGLVPMVVCSRTQELQALGERLRLEEAVELQAPSDAEVDRYLGYLEATGTSIADLRTALASDQDLRQLLRSPLLLHVVALAYHGRPASALYVPGTLPQRQAWLWEAYVGRMFEQRPLDHGAAYTEDHALAWLAWLARALRDRDQTEFHLDRLAPGWLPPAQQRRARVATGLVGGLGTGVVFGPAFGLVAQAFGLTFTLPRALAVGGVAGLMFGLIGGLVFGLAGRLPARFEQTQQPRWSWSKLRARPAYAVTVRLRQEQAAPGEGVQQSVHHAPVAAAYGLAAGLTAGLAGGLIYGSTFGLLAALAATLGCGLTVRLVFGLSGELLFEQTEQLRWSWSKLRAGLARALVGGMLGGLVFGILFVLLFGPSAGLDFGPVFGLAVALAGALSAGLVVGLRKERAVPNEGIRRSAQHALAVGLSAGLSGGLAGGLAAGLSAGPSAGLSAGLGFGLVFALTVAMVFGGAACLQHYVLRAWLVREGVAPWQYGPFLEAMAQRLLLRRSGSAYLFAHRLLRDYLADPNPDRIRAAA
jgi:eukaryotic-like serine/threonine-protein kinase